MASNDLLSRVRKGLNARRGKWQQIAAETGVPYFTLSKIASGATKDPRWGSLSPLADWIEASEEADGKQAASA